MIPIRSKPRSLRSPSLARTRVPGALCCLALAALLGCGDLGTEPDDGMGNGNGGGNGSGGDTTVTYTEVRALLQAKGCLSPSCHGSAPGNGGLDLRTYDSTIDGGVNGNTVVSGDSGASTLYTKTTSSPPFLSRMPLTGTPLSLAEQRTIADWIDQGAKND